MSSSPSTLLAAAVLSVLASSAPGSLQGLYVVVHVVRGGDSAASLVRAYKTTRGTLEGLNPHLNLDGLKEGDRVRILSQPGVFQKLQPGLTVSDVALAYQTSRDELLRANGITDPRRISSGRVLFIPEREPLAGERRRRLERMKRKPPVPVPRGLFAKPLAVEHRLIQSDGFGPRRHPISGSPQMHSGTDLVAPYGTPILAARAGVVAFSGIRGEYGKLVILRHDGGYETYYGHATELFVREGESVVAGQVIARVGMTGGATAPHLHFEVRHGGSPRNPAKYLRQYY